MLPTVAKYRCVNVLWQISQYLNGKLNDYRFWFGCCCGGLRIVCLCYIYEWIKGPCPGPWLNNTNQIANVLVNARASSVFLQSVVLSHNDLVYIFLKSNSCVLS